jgi:Tfp pilus assembly protein PilV
MKFVLNQKGQSLVEVIVALSIAVIVVMAFTSATLNAMRDAQFAKNQNQATRVAQKTLELVRAVRDQDNEVYTDGTTWSDLYDDSSLNGGRCFTLDETTLTMAYTVTCDVSYDSVFTRQIKLTTTTTNRIDVYVIVKWTDNKGTHSAEANTFLSNWQ